MTLPNKTALLSLPDEYTRRWVAQMFCAAVARGEPIRDMEFLTPHRLIKVRVLRPAGPEEEKLWAEFMRLSIWDNDTCLTERLATLLVARCAITHELLALPKPAPPEPHIGDWVFFTFCHIVKSGGAFTGIDMGHPDGFMEYRILRSPTPGDPTGYFNISWPHGIVKVRILHGPTPEEQQLWAEFEDANTDDLYDRIQALLLARCAITHEARNIERLCKRDDS